MMPDNLGMIEKLFIVGHANINTIGNIHASEIVPFLRRFNMSNNTNVFLCGCSTGNTNQQVLDGGFVAGLPLADKIREWRKDIGIFITRSALLRRKSDGALFLAPSLNQGITGRETGWDVFRRIQ